MGAWQYKLTAPAQPLRHVPAMAGQASVGAGETKASEDAGTWGLTFAAPRQAFDGFHSPATEGRRRLMASRPVFIALRQGVGRLVVSLLVLVEL